jgi:ABC-type nitrate/sulfonate/bicarbonate transport system substrate-binding protein
LYTNISQVRCGSRLVLVVLWTSVMALLGSLLIVLPRCAPEKGDEIVFAGTHANIAGLRYVADARGLFERNGLSVTIKNFQSGPLSLKELESGAADVATLADFPFVANSFKTGNLKIVGTLARGGGMQIIARRDSRITKAADLVGRTVAVPKNTIAQFFLGAYCQRNGISYGRIRVVYMPPEEVVEAMKKGTVNAACVWSPFIEQVRDNLGDEAVLLPSYGRTDYYALLVTRDDVIREKPAVIDRLLKTMLDAERYAKEHPDEAMKIVAKGTGLTIDQIRRGWAESRYEVRLDQDLLTLMEAEAQWMIMNKLTPKQEMPNYLDMIYLKGLLAVKPEAVGVIH